MLNAVLIDNHKLVEFDQLKQQEATMCFGMGCLYEDCRGECKCHGSYPPSDAACREGEREDLYDPFIDDDDDSGEERDD